MTTTNPSKPKYTLVLTQVTKNGDGNLVWDAIDITVGCLIERIDVPTKPADITYNILASAVPLTLTPPFLQYPPCDYAITHSITWELGVNNNAPVTVTSGNPYSISIQTNDHSKNAIYQMKLKDRVTWTDSVVGAQVFDVSQSFQLTVLDPCKTTDILPISTITNMTVVLGTT